MDHPLVWVSALANGNLRTLHKPDFEPVKTCWAWDCEVFHALFCAWASSCDLQNRRKPSGAWQAALLGDCRVFRGQFEGSADRVGVGGAGPMDTAATA